MFTSSWFAANVFAVNMVVLCIAGGMVGLLAWAIMKRDEREMRDLIEYGKEYAEMHEMKREILQSLHIEIEQKMVERRWEMPDTPWEMPDMLEYESDDWYDKAEPDSINRVAHFELGSERYYTDQEWLIENALITMCHRIQTRVKAKGNEDTKVLRDIIMQDIKATHEWLDAFIKAKDHTTFGHLVLPRGR